MAIKKVLASSVSNNAAGDPFAFISLIIVGMLTIGLIGTIFSVVLGKMEKKMVRGGSKS